MNHNKNAVQMGLRIYFFLWMSGVLLVMETGCRKYSRGPETGPLKTESKQGDAVGQLLEEIEHCPPWSLLASDDRRGRQGILDSLRRISRAKTRDIRQASEEFITRLQSKNRCDIDGISRLFVMNRYLFDVPASSKLSEAKFFGGWFGVPHDNQNVNLLWPFSIDNNHKLVLDGTFAGYNGDDFDAIDEFDYFEQRFGRRKDYADH